MTRSETASASSFCLAGSVSRRKAERSFSMSGSHGQPNHALSQSPLVKELPAGLSASTVTVVVKKMFQPPLSGASFLVRRATTVCQSIACRSALEAHLLQRLLGDGRELVGRLQVGRLHHDDRRAVVAAFLQELARLVVVGLDQEVAVALLVRRAADQRRVA